MEKYNALVHDLCLYEDKIRESLLKQAQISLDILDDSIIAKSHQTYSERKVLSDHMNEEIDKRVSKYEKKLSFKRIKEYSEQQKEEAYTFYSKKLSEQNQLVKEEKADDKESVNYIQEQSIKLEDQVFIKFGIKYTDLRVLIRERIVEAETETIESAREV